MTCSRPLDDTTEAPPPRQEVHQSSFQAVLVHDFLRAYRREQTLHLATVINYHPPRKEDMTDLPLVWAVVLAWNQKDETVACLDSLLHSDYPQMQLLVVDNGSTDGTAETVQQLYPQVMVVRSPVNLGIAAGYNLGLNHALAHRAEYILVANNDIVVDESMVRHLAESMADRPEVGMIMPKIYHYYGDQYRLWCTGARWRKFPPSVKMMGYNVKDAPRYSRSRELEFAPSCCLLIRRQVVEHIGGFDPGYFFYSDDWDYSARVRAAGYHIRFDPAAKLWHKVSVSTQKSEKPSRWWYTMGRSTVRFYRQHSTSSALITYSAWFTVREIVKLKPRRVLPFLTGVKHELACKS